MVNMSPLNWAIVCNNDKRQAPIIWKHNCWNINACLNPQQLQSCSTQTWDQCLIIFQSSEIRIGIVPGALPTPSIQVDKFTNNFQLIYQHILFYPNTNFILATNFAKVGVSPHSYEYVQIAQALCKHIVDVKFCPVLTLFHSNVIM